MKRGRVMYDGLIYPVTQSGFGGVLFEDGQSFTEEEVAWLPPIESPCAIFALELNYAAHAKELAFKAPSEPLIFLKGPLSLTGHRECTTRPVRRSIQCTVRASLPW